MIVITKLASLVPINAQADADSERVRYLFVGEYRSALMAKHPVIRDKQLCITPPVKEAFEAIRVAIYYRQKGLCFIAQPSVGKSFAILALKEMLSQQYPGLPVYSVEAHCHSVPTEKTVYGDILYGLKHALGSSTASRITALAMSNAALNIFQMGCSTLESDQAVLIVDEAQSWQDKEWAFLKGLVNRLATGDIRARLLVISFGQPELRAVIEKLTSGSTEGKGRDLQSRFFSKICDFRGIVGLSDVVDILRRFDDPSCDDFPDGSGISYSEFFYPRAFGTGWRLEREAPTLWSVLEEVYGFEQSLPMTPFFQIIKAFLVSFTDEKVMQPSTSELWSQAAATSSLRQYTFN